jgi:branched-chain amino acid transport system ATP-binding protein
MKPALLSLEEVSRRFGGLAAVTDLSFDVASGEICGLIGPNGAGKSTTFNLITGELQPSNGRVVFLDHDITNALPHVMARMGIARMFQAINLFESMTVGLNVLAGADQHDRLGMVSAALRLPKHYRREAAAIARARASLKLLDLDQVADNEVAALPFGQQRMVAVARALAASPRLLLLDEPAAGLSQVEIDVLERAMRRARDNGVTILMVEHNVEFVLRACDHIVVLQGGRKIADGTPREIRTDAVVQEAYLGA